MQFVTLTTEHLPQIEAWFDDPQTQRYLGGRDWVRRAIKLMHISPREMYRGKRIVARYVWVVYNESQPVGLLDIESYADGSAGFAFVVAPEARGRNIGSRILSHFGEMEELRNVQKFVSDVEPENAASRRCLEKAGFLVAKTPNEEGMLPVMRVERRA